MLASEAPTRWKILFSLFIIQFCSSLYIWNSLYHFLPIKCWSDSSLWLPFFSFCQLVNQYIFYQELNVIFKPIICFKQFYHLYWQSDPLFNLCDRGLASVLQLLIEVVSVILDVVSRPMWWGISAEMGLKLPFSAAYFPYNCHVYRILSGTLSAESFLHLVSIINLPVSCSGKHSRPTIKKMPMKISTIDHKSVW